MNFGMWVDLSKGSDWRQEVSQGGKTLFVRSGIFQIFSICDLVHEELTIARCAQDPTIPYSQLNIV